MWGGAGFVASGTAVSGEFKIGGTSALIAWVSAGALPF